MTINNKKGFTLVELLVVVGVIGILATVVLTALSGARNKAHSAATIAELSSLAKSFQIYEIDNSAWPADVSPDVLPTGMAEYLPGGWPEGGYPGSEYDWEYWGPGTANEAIQVSVRFCESGTCNFPDEDWADGFTNQSAAYYCISGQCRPWESDLVGAVPGHCFNC